MWYNGCTYRVKENMDYKLCTVEELAEYVLVSSPQRITQQLLYYQKAENAVMVEKIKEARKIARKKRLTDLLESLG